VLEFIVNPIATRRNEDRTDEQEHASALGTCELIATEKTMRTGVNTISLNWQAEFNHGCYIKKVVKPVMRKKLLLPSETINA
jgi:hypothetical protein